MAITRRWVFGTNDLGDYISCEKCGHKIAAKHVVFGKYDLNTCPFCESEMDLDQKDLDRLKDGLRETGGEVIG